MWINIILFFQFVPTTRSMHPGLNLSMQHIPNTEHHSEVPFQPTDNQGDPYHPSTAVGMQPPSLGSGVDVVKRPVQEVFVVDLTKINGSFGISLTVWYFLFFFFIIQQNIFYSSFNIFNSIYKFKFYFSFTFTIKLSCLMNLGLKLFYRKQHFVSQQSTLLRGPSFLKKLDFC